MTTEKIDLNRADAKTLATLPGIGSKLAERIVSHREKEGRFKSLSELTVISGISHQKLKTIESFVFIDPDLGRESDTGTKEDTWQINGYQIEKQISKSGRADTFLAHKLGENDRNQLEVIQGSFSLDSELYQAYSWSTLPVSSISHPNIIKISDLDITEDGELILVRPYVKGQILSDYLVSLAERNDMLSPVEALLVIKPLADALRVALRSGVVHKHLTPGSILLQDDHNPLLKDLDTPDSELTAYGEGEQPAVEILYFSPEQLEGKAIDGRSNIYSLGIILYELLVGKPIESIGQHSASIELLEKIRPDLSDATYYLVKTCIERDAWSRFQRMQDLLVSIDEAVEAEKYGDVGLMMAPPVKSLTGEEASIEVTSDGKRAYLLGWIGQQRRPYIAGVFLLLLFLFFVAIRMSSQGESEGNGGQTRVDNERIQSLLTATGAPTFDFVEGTLTARARLVSNPALLDATPTFIPTPTDTPTATPTDTPTATPTDTPTATPTDTPTDTPTATPTATETTRPSSTFTPSPTIPPPTSPPPKPTSRPPPTATSPPAATSPPTSTPPSPG